MNDKTKATLQSIRKQKRELCKQLDAVRSEMNKVWEGKNDYEFLMAIKDTPIAKQESEIVEQIQKLYFQERLIKDGFQVA